MNYGIGNVKGLDKSKSLFTTTTAPTESGGVITLATTDIVESGFKVGDYLAYVDSDNISALYSISAISNSIATLSLIGNIGGGGGKQLYQHNLKWLYYDNSNNRYDLNFIIINDSNVEFTNDTFFSWLVNNGFDALGSKLLTPYGFFYTAVGSVYSGINSFGYISSGSTDKYVINYYLGGTSTSIQINKGSSNIHIKDIIITL